MPNEIQNFFSENVTENARNDVFVARKKLRAPFCILPTRYEKLLYSSGSPEVTFREQVINKIRLAGGAANTWLFASPQLYCLVDSKCADDKDEKNALISEAFGYHVFYCENIKGTFACKEAETAECLRNSYHLSRRSLVPGILPGMDGIVSYELSSVRHLTIDGLWPSNPIKPFMK
ncbi:unnamed protein product [Larinioides sclopetarius]|uniref:Uncharacterized protein n=1 Tax=Larinioides sclopetarius TaxID=280406 RepID=A0AAV1YSD6_9ARAC